MATRQKQADTPVDPKQDIDPLVLGANPSAAILDAPSDAGTDDEKEFRRLLVLRELKKLQKEQALEDRKKSSAENLRSQISEERQYRKHVQSMCRHRKEDERTALAGQELTSGVTVFTCLKCGRLAPQDEWEPTLWPSLNAIGKAQGTR